ncbi:unnamed protein product [Caenorhabditis nigoni]
MAPIPLLRLPESNILNIIELLDSWEKIKFAICSAKSAGFLAKKSLKSEKMFVQLGTHQYGVHIVIDSVKFGFHLVPIWCISSTWIPMNSDRFLEKSSVDPAGETMEISRKLQLAFDVQECAMGLNLGNLELEEEMRSLMRNAFNLKITNINLTRGNLDFDALCYAMNTLQISTNVDIRGKFPSGFSHENALNFKSIYYEDANWVTLDMLKLIKTGESLQLQNTNLTSMELNQFLLHWLKCENDVMRQIQLDSNAEIDENILFAGITVEQTNDPKCYLIRLCQSKANQFRTGKLIFLRKRCRIYLETAM